jgi:tRNA pseudouridine32 synthase/23S rRNA pseudouridine746 synthase
MPTERHSRIVPGAHFMQMQEAPAEGADGPNAHTHTHTHTHTHSAHTHSAHTQIELIDVQGDWARYRLRPLTGHKHQLRVHMAALKLPIVGDRIYPVLRFEAETGAEPDYRDPLRLLAGRLAFTCPITGHDKDFFSEQSLHWPS